MPLSNCARCKQMFNKIGKAICPECEPAEEADYAKVRAIIDLDPNLNMEQAAEQAGVEIWVVNRMIDSGIITTVTASEKVYCGKCGAPAISMSKRLCEACLDRLNLEVAEAQRSLRQEKAPAPPQKSPPRMHVRRTVEEKWQR